MAGVLGFIIGTVAVIVMLALAWFFLTALIDEPGTQGCIRCAQKQKRDGNWRLQSGEGHLLDEDGNWKGVDRG
jgi:hypothetical protein